MTYTCAICGKTYDKIADRAQCEMDCTAAEEKRKKAETEKRLKTEKLMLEKKIEAKLNEAEQLIESYYERYNEIPNMSYAIKNGNTVFNVGGPENANVEKEIKNLDFLSNPVFKDIVKQFIF